MLRTILLLKNASNYHYFDCDYDYNFDCDCDCDYDCDYDRVSDTWNWKKGILYNILHH